MVALKTDADLNKFLESICLTINLFHKSLEYIRSTDQTFVLEYGSFLYQFASFCSRQLKMAKLIPTHFSSAAIEPRLREKCIELLQMSLEIYKRANESTSSSSSTSVTRTREESKIIVSEESTTRASHTTADGDSMSSSNLNPADGENVNRRAAVDKAKQDSDAAVEWGEDWLHHYMFGKIKEKLSYPLMECLEHYKKVILN